MRKFDSLRQRKLAQWGIAYLAAAWVLLQVLDFLGEAFGWSPYALRVATVVAAAGFTVVLVLAWYHGEQGRQRVGAIELILLGVIALIASGAAWLVRERPTTQAPLVLPPEARSIAVLAFVDMSPGKDQEYFSDGITEEILNALARTRGLRVAARTSSFSFKGRNVPVDEIAHRLRVTHVLEGSVRRDGNRVRITAQLIEAANGFHLWSETFDRELTDIFAVQEEISSRIADKLQLEIAAVESRTHSQDAYDLYLRGRQGFAARTPEGLRNAVDYFEQAIAADSQFAPAHAGLAGALIVLPFYTDARSTELQPRAKAAANRAISLDSTLAEAWAALGYARFTYDQDWQQSETALRKALRLNPNLATAYLWYGDLLGARNRVKEAANTYEQATRLDPLSAVLRTSLGWMYMADQRLDDAAAQLQHAIQIDSTFIDARTHLARTRVFQGRYAEGIAGLEQTVAQSGRRSRELGFLGHAYGLAGRSDDARRILNELEARSKQVFVSPINLAFVHIGLGDYDRVFAEIEAARKAGDPWLTENNFDLVFDPLRNDKRWRAHLKRMRLDTQM